MFGRRDGFMGRREGRFGIDDRDIIAQWDVPRGLNFGSKSQESRDAGQYQ